MKYQVGFVENLEARKPPERSRRRWVNIVKHVSNRVPFENKTEALPIEPTFSVS
jgi:hypothetical protein